MSRFLFVWSTTAIVLMVVGCSRSEPAPDSSLSPQAGGQTKKQVAVQLNWFPEAEHGGVYQALADQTYAQSGLEVDILPGGRATRVDAEVHLGRCQFAIANADDVVLFRGQGMDIVAVMAVAQNHPRCILVQQQSGVTDFEGLAGMTLQSQTGRPFLEFMRSKGLLDQVTQRPYHGSVSSLVEDPTIAIQAYSYAEPLLAQQQGVKVRKLMVSDLGWNPYSSVLITSGQLIRDDPELVRTFVTATRLGWQNYFTDPSQGNTAILSANKHGMTAEVLQFGSKGLQALAMPGEMELAEVGAMATERWKSLVDQMVSLQLVDAAKVKAEDCFTTEFLD